MSFEEEERQRKNRKKKREDEEEERKRKEEEASRSRKELLSKIHDEERDQWRYDQMRAPVSLQINGDHALAQAYMGEAKALLWSVKNALNLNKLKQGEGERTFKDGTRIRAKSISGLDSVEIDTSKSTLLAAGIGPESCTITFINLPLSVPPMRHPGIIDGAPGVDYFKTYYSFDVNKCPTCREIAWDLLFTYSKPFEARHYKNPLHDNRDEPDNHSVYSLESPCWAEILDHGQDGVGYFIIWKAYTEMGDVTFSRTGLGIMLLTAAISNASGVLCSQQAKVDVDCCKKTDDLRKVEIWWEGVHGCMPFLIYGSKHICKMPSSVPIGGASGLIAYSTPFYAAQPLYAIPSVKGGCLPFEWILTGPIKLINTEPGIKTVTYFQITAGPGDCKSPITITLKDRCGTSYTVMGTPCCDDAEGLSISYTSLLMTCSQSQDFQAQGGCGPYSWSIVAGGGTINDGGHYIAPATNANCIDNPTIQVSDCCGNVATVSLAINCYTQQGGAFVMGTCEIAGCWCSPDGCLQGISVCRNFHIIQWSCDGTVLSDCETNPGLPCSGGPSGWTQVDCSDYGWACPDINYGCWTNQCGCGGASPCTCDTLLDIRSSGMKAAGCCPLNPITGLPY